MNSSILALQSDHRKYFPILFMFSAEAGIFRVLDFAAPPSHSKHTLAPGHSFMEWFSTLPSATPLCQPVLSALSLQSQ